MNLKAYILPPLKLIFSQAMFSQAIVVYHVLADLKLKVYSQSSYYSLRILAPLIISNMICKENC